MIFSSHKKRKAAIIGLFLPLIILVVYLNRSYAHIYNTLGAADLKSPDQAKTYLMTSNMNNANKIIYDALGDSLTAGVGADDYNQSYPYLLARGLTANGEVILNVRAASGMRTAEALASVVPLAIKDNPDIITLLIGVNDIHDNINESDFQKNYEEILRRLSKETKAKIYVINIPVIGAETLVRPPYNIYFDVRTRQFNKIIAALADKYSVSQIDLYTSTASLFKTAGDHYSIDLFHPSAAGYKIWADIIYAGLNK